MARSVQQTYVIEAYELWAQRYRVKARSPEDALRKFYKGSAAAVDDTAEYLELAEEYGLSPDQLQERGLNLGRLPGNVDAWLPGVRDIFVDTGTDAGSDA